MPRSYGLSLLLHIGIMLVFAFGFPIMFHEDKEYTPTALTVEIVPVSDITNLKKSQKPLTQDPKPMPKPVKPVQPTKKETPKPAPKPDAVPLPDKPKEATKPDKPKPQPPKKEETKQKDEEDEFAVLMNKLKTDAPSEDEVKEKPKEDAKSGSTSRSDTYDPTIPLSISEKDAIRSQFVKCWRMPAGARGDYSLAVLVEVRLNPDGTVLEAGLSRSQVSRYQSDTFFRAAADAALRAVNQCSPLQGLPADKYSGWKFLELNFDPQELLY